jgi:hypothetical protein
MSHHELDPNIRVEVTPSGKTSIVHKDGHEGSIVIDGMTGIILTPTDQRPEWVTEDNIAAAVVSERFAFYEKRLGPDYARSIQFAELIDFRDLQWLALDEEGELLEPIEADAEYRMDIIAEAVGADREEGTISDVAYETAVSLDVERTDAEAEDLEDMAKADFGAATG